jgi:hypothetical protein
MRRCVTYKNLSSRYYFLLRLPSLSTRKYTEHNAQSTEYDGCSNETRSWNVLDLGVQIRPERKHNQPIRTLGVPHFMDKALY